jgi:hypothetical protein
LKRVANKLFIANKIERDLDRKLQKTFVIQQKTFYYLTNALKRVANKLFIANKIERDWDPILSNSDFISHFDLFDEFIFWFQITRFLLNDK